MEETILKALPGETFYDLFLKAQSIAKSKQVYCGISAIHNDTQVTIFHNSVWDDSLAIYHLKRQLNKK